MGSKDQAECLWLFEDASFNREWSVVRAKDGAREL